MLTDAHCHPFDLTGRFPEFDSNGFLREGLLAAASACSINEFTHNEEIQHKIANSKLFLCFGIHPQIFISRNEQKYYNSLIEYLFTLCTEKRIAAIGEIGFDFFNAGFRETEAIQERFFAEQLDIALQFELPIVLHIRRAMNKVFNYSKKLSKCKSVVFHSWSGTFEEIQSILRHGVNAYFSFGNTVTLNHKQAMRSLALLPAERLLTETDAPYQPRRGLAFSHWGDLPFILETAAGLRSEAGNGITAKELELQTERNFRDVFCFLP